LTESSAATVVWRHVVDDLKISHVDTRVFDEILEVLNKKYGKEAPLLTVTRGKMHD